MGFNGYYSLVFPGSAPGAFFAIDTYAKYNKGRPLVFDINLIISIDGKTSNTAKFNGSFEDNRLIQTIDGINIDLTFVQAITPDGTEAPFTAYTTASYRGTITAATQSFSATGVTYNNIISSSLFKGTYYWVDKGVNQGAVLKIGDDNEILYDFGSNDGTLKPVDSFIYNMNMYYFIFGDKNEYHLIMGTGGASGFACNNMNATDSGNVQRNLQTIVFSEPKPPADPKQPKAPTIGQWLWGWIATAMVGEYEKLENYAELAAFSGYYPLPSIHPLAFFSVQAQYVLQEGLPIYFIAITVSLDGVTSMSYPFDSTMFFKDNKLTMPEQQIEFTFERIYDPSRKSLVTIRGAIGQYPISEASTPFNPVPLSAWKGVPMTDKMGNTLTIVNDRLVTYNDQVKNSFVYVPLMYIMANPYENSDFVLSLGTSSTQGLASIVLIPQSGSDKLLTSFVYAIPDAKPLYS